MKSHRYQTASSRVSARKKWAVVLALMLIISISAGATLAYFAMSTPSVSNTFTAGSVGAQITESFDGTAKTSITVNNSGESPVYVRVKLVSYWMLGETIAPKSSPDLNFTLSSDWKEIGGYYYYTSPLAGAADTTNLLGSSIVMAADGEYKQVVEVLAETVQATPDEAVEALWGVSAAQITG